MFFRISFVLGTIISLLFVAFCSYILFYATDIASAGRSVSVMFLIANLFFLSANFICTKIKVLNRDDVLITRKLKIAGKFLFVLSMISIVVTLFSAMAALISYFSSNMYLPGNRLPAYFMITSLLFLSSMFAIINLLYFKRLLRINNQVTSQIINDIMLH